MAKRFTDSEKWKNPSFRSLPNTYRWLWIYLLDNCDFSGVWRTDFELASYCIGAEIIASDALKHFQDKIIVIDHDKWFIPSFITFQYGELKEASKLHQSVIRTLVGHGLDPKKQGVSKGYPRGIHTPKDKDKEKNKVKEKEKEKEREIKKPIYVSARQMFEDLPQTTRDRFTKLYPEDEFMRREVLRCYGYYTDDPKKLPQSSRGWAKALSSWLERGWERRPKPVTTNGFADQMGG